MSLLREIQSSAIGTDTPVPVLLRKCRVLAQRLQHEELKAWVQKELEGYSGRDKLPSYRVLMCTSFGTLFGNFGRELRNVPLPLANLEPRIREALSSAHIFESVGALHDMAAAAESEMMTINWKSDVILMVRDRFVEGMNLISARQVFSKSAVAGVLDTVRNKVLSFALEIEAQNPEAGDAPLNSQPPIPLPVVNNIFNTNIGSVGNFAAGNTNVSQTYTAGITAGDFQSLTESLRSLGIGPEEIATLEAAVKAEPALENGSFGKRVAAWTGKTIAKGLKGGLKIGADVAAAVLTDALRRYYGLPPAA